MLKYNKFEFKCLYDMISVFRSFYIEYGEKNTGSQFVI